MPKRKHAGRERASASAAGGETRALELVTNLDRAIRRLILSGAERGVGPSFSRSEIAVVDTLGAEGAMAMGELAARVRLPVSTASRVADRLAARGILQRERLPENRRIVRVELARDGRRFHQAALRGRISGARQMLARLSAREQDELIRLFRKIADSTVEEPET